MRQILSILILLLTTYACNNILSNDKQTIEIDLPDTSSSQPSKMYYLTKNKATAELMMDKLENGVDSLEIRLWGQVANLKIGHVYVIKKISNQWTCLDYSYLQTYPTFEGLIYTKVYWTSFIIDTFWINKKQPKTNWNNFFNAIENEGIYDLPSQSEIKGFRSDFIHGIDYFVEYATNKKYKFYWYNCPDCYEDRFQECKHMTNILEVFHREFGLSLKLNPIQENDYRCRPKKTAQPITGALHQAGCGKNLKGMEN